MTNIETSTYEVIRFCDAQISAMNPRAVTSDESIERLAANIRSVGLIHPLAGIKMKDGNVEIVAGGRRLRALALCQDDPRFQSFPVHIAPDEQTASAWASAENANRENLHPADEIRDYGNHAIKGADVATIATAYGVTEPHVYRRLALAKLPAPVLAALRDNQISLSSAAAFTVSNDEEITLTVLEQIKGDNYSAARIKTMLKPQAIRHTDRRAIFVGETAYKAAGGRMTEDLFSDEATYDDPEILSITFEKALQNAAEGIQQSGFSWCKPHPETYIGYNEINDMKAARIYPTPGELSESDVARYDELAGCAEAESLSDDEADELQALQNILDGSFTSEERAICGVIVYVNCSGTLKQMDGIILPEQMAAAIEAGLLENKEGGSASDDKPKSPISNALRDDLSRVSKGAEQEAVIHDPNLLLDLLAYQLSHNLNWQSPLAIRTDKVPTMPTTELEGYTLGINLTTTPPDMWKTKDFGASFRAFRKKGDDHVKAELTRCLASLYTGGNETLNALVSKSTKPDTRKIWTPTKDNFFKRVSGGYLDGLWSELLGVTADNPVVLTFQKLKKAEKTEKLHDLFNNPETPAFYNLTAEQIARIGSWLPEDMT